MLGATVCRRHGGSAPQVRRNAEQLAAIWEFRASLPFLQSWVDSLTSEYNRQTAEIVYGDQPRRCRAHRKDGQPCRAWAIRGGYVCRKHGGAAPQVRAKAEQRLLAAKVHRQMERRRKSLRQACDAARRLTAGITSPTGPYRRRPQDHRHGTKAPVTACSRSLRSTAERRSNCGTCTAQALNLPPFKAVCCTGSTVARGTIEVSPSRRPGRFKATAVTGPGRHGVRAESWDRPEGRLISGRAYAARGARGRATPISHARPELGRPWKATHEASSVRRESARGHHVDHQER